MRFQAVIFDLFGTIVAGFAGSSARYQERFAAALDLPHDQLAQQWRQLTARRTLGEFQTVEESIQNVCVQLGATVTAAQMMNAVEIRLELTRNALTPRADAIATFQQLKQAGLKIGLLSNCSIEIPIVWPESEFAEWFDAAVFSSIERIKKPAPEIYHLACNRLGVEPKESIYVADGENYELTAARQIGMHPVLIQSDASVSDIRREAREWQGDAVSSLPALLEICR